jgi:hypothetical protein
MPGGHAKFGVVAIGDGSPAGGERFLNNVRGVDTVNVAAGKNVERAAEGGVGIKGVDLVGGSDVDMDGEIRGLSEEKICIQKKCREKKGGAEITHGKLLVRGES